MHSAEYIALEGVADILRQEGIDPSRMADELAVLVSWASLSHKEHGGLEWSEQQPDLGYAFEQMTESLGEHGRFFSESRLPKLSAKSVNAIKGHLNALSDASAIGLAKALVAVVEGLERSGQVITYKLGRLLAELCAPGQEKTVLHHDGSVTALVALENPEKADLSMRTVSAYSWVVSDLLGSTLTVGDAFGSETPPGTAGFVISTPPFQASEFSKSSKLKSDELAVLRTARECRVRGVVCASLGILFSRAAMGIREELINENWLDAVIGLPKGTLLNTHLASVILVINKDREKDTPIVFIDAEAPQTDSDIDKLLTIVRNKKTSPQSATAFQSDLQKNDYDLTISRYKLGRAAQQLKQLESAVSLDGVAEIVRAQSLKDADDHEGATVFLEASVRDITEPGRMGLPEKTVHVDKKNLRRAQSQRLYPGDLLLAIKGSVGRVAYVDDACGDNWVASQAFVIIRPKGTAVSSPYLYRYLASELIQEYIEETATGAVMALLKAADVSNIQVPLPDAEFKHAVESTHTEILSEYDAIREHRNNIQGFEKRHWTLKSTNTAPDEEL
ncbi:hypothetical protein ABA45_02390 [Marinobacter psychrophilus]|uniref:site-specific DNA-methyltransferase (adenine-specific) n=2 Tax=Marinobacter psychrophilus TaxID=330734 RepID=A0A0H4HXM2_9GAMM|nr:hypothetical protein ABA45_02390 [Marinobacter psychrophilus]